MGEAKRVRAVVLYEEGAVNAPEAAEMVERSVRQFYRILARYRREGEFGLAHRNRGRRSPKRLLAEEEAKIVKLRKTKYEEMNDVHLTQFLNEKEGISVGREKVRLVLRASGIPPKHGRRQPKHRSRRERKPRAGMMLQVDGSEHAWLPGKKRRISLVTAIDDATGELVYARFHEVETTAAYLLMLRSIVSDRGVPMSVYADKHSSFKTTRKPTLNEQLEGIQMPKTQVGRAMSEAGISYIPAHSPQAKGRVERAFETLQDRLVVEMQLAGVSSIEEANDFLVGFLADHNKRFAKPPADAEPAWRQVPEDFDPDKVFCLKEKRIVKADNTISYNTRVLQIPPNAKRASYAKTWVEVRELLNDSIRVYYKDEMVAKFDPEDENDRRKSKSKRKVNGQKHSYCRA